MKKILIASLFFIICISSRAQNSALSIGGNYNADVTNHKLGKINYPSCELSFEKALCKNISINGTLNYAKRQYDIQNDYQLIMPGASYLGPNSFVNYDKTLIVSGRFYLKSFKSGIYFELGIPFTYTTEKVNLSSGISVQNTTDKYSYSINTIGGFGIDCPIFLGLGLELNMSFSPSLNLLDVDYGTSGFIKSGVKIYWAI